MPKKESDKKVPADQLRWRLNPATLSFETTVRPKATQRDYWTEKRCGGLSFWHGYG